MKQDTNEMPEIGGSLWDLYLAPVAPLDIRRDVMRTRLAFINERLGTNYAEKHMDNWIAGRKPTPLKVLNHVRRYVIHELLPGGGEALCELLEI